MSSIKCLLFWAAQRSLLLTLCVVPWRAGAAATPLTYGVTTVALTNGYMVSGGYITTNGKLGAIAAADILDYRFNVTGLYSFEFSPHSGFSPNIQLVGELWATGESLVLPWSSLPQPTNTLSLLDAVGRQNYSLYYQNGVYDPHESASRVSYFLIPSTPGVTGSRDFPYGNAMTIAIIPEPGSVLLVLTASATSAVFLSTTRYRSRKTSKGGS